MHCTVEECDGSVPPALYYCQGGLGTAWQRDTALLAHAHWTVLLCTQPPLLALRSIVPCLLASLRGQASLPQTVSLCIIKFWFLLQLGLLCSAEQVHDSFQGQSARDNVP